MQLPERKLSQLFDTFDQNYKIIITDILLNLKQCDDELLKSTGNVNVAILFTSIYEFLDLGVPLELPLEEDILYVQEVCHT